MSYNCIIKLHYEMASSKKNALDIIHRVPAMKFTPN